MSDPRRPVDGEGPFDYAPELRALAQAHADDDAAIARILATVPTARPAPRPVRRRLAAGTVLAAAAAVVAVVGVRWWTAPTLRSLAGTGDVAVLARGVEARVDGTGDAVVDGRTTRVAWRSGRLTVEVDPEARRDLWVVTDEATVHVVGTGFTVDRDGFGTDVSVVHGRVEVVCASDPTPVTLGPGADRRCLRDAGTGLGRLLALEAGGAPAEERLQAAEDALAHPVGLDATRRALAVRRVEILAELGRTDEAVTGARALPRDERVAEASARALSAMGAGGCAAAAPWLRILTDDRDVPGTLLAMRCAPEPDQAQALLYGLDGVPIPADGETASAVEAWKTALGKND